MTFLIPLPLIPSELSTPGRLNSSEKQLFQNNQPVAEKCNTFKASL